MWDFTQKEKSPEIQVTDMENRKYTLGDIIGQGGQGAVYRVKKDCDIAVKLVTDKDGLPLKTDDAIRDVSQKLTDIRILPLPYDINLSRPLTVLKSHAGYVMSLMSDMKSFAAFLKLNDKVEKYPPWLSDDKQQPISGAEVWFNFCKTGGLRTRLHALYKISELLAAIHAKGLVYGDISSGNLMYKETESGITAGLIDTDNINFAGKSKTYFTPGFGAPEITTGKSDATVYSDSYAFAVVAFLVLTMLHPFKGKKVFGAEDEDEDWANTVTSQQKSDPGNFNDDGSYSWIFDQNDDSNSYGDLGQVQTLFLTPLLFALFDNTFSAGHNKPKLRTPLIRWPHAFAQATDLTIKCPSCGMSYYYDYEENNRHCCPYCSADRGHFVLVQSYFKTGKAPLYTFVHEINEKELYLPSRCFQSFKINKADKPILGLTLKDGAIELRLMDNKEVLFIQKDTMKERFIGTYKFKVSNAHNFSITLTSESRKIIISGGQKK